MAADRCTEADAVEAAKALDDNKLNAATQKLRECGFDSTNVLVNLPKFQQFVERVFDLHEKGKGLDMTLKYGVGRGTAFYLDGVEIK